LSGCGRLQLYLIKADGTGVKPIDGTDEEGGDCGGGWFAEWSPDGTEIIYTFAVSASAGGKCAPSSTWFLKRLNVLSGEQTTVADDACINHWPSWRPVGDE
jgi:hypothetical protein